MTGNREQFDAIVIGTGQGGGPLSSAFARSGTKTAIIERAFVGGSCINYGCTPTKTMIASARVAHMARRAADYGVQAGEISVDLARVRERKREMVSSFRSGSQNAIESTEGLELIFGEASFTGHKEIHIALEDGGTRQLTADTIVINTGARPMTPPVDGLDQVEPLDSTTIMELGEVPEHLVVVGGGYVGLEFAQMFRRFGSEVTIVQRGDRIMKQEDRDVTDAMTEILREDGITVLLGGNARRCYPANGGVELRVETDEGEKTVTGSHLLLSTGRTPNSDALNLPATGVEADDAGFITVNSRLETNVPGVYVIGDVKGGPAFTHISYDDFRVLRTNLLENGSASINDRLVAYTVFTDPQLGRVGLTEAMARDRGYDVRTASMPMSSVPRAIETDETRGMMKAVVDGKTDQILGAAILGIEGGEIVSIIQTAMMGKLPYTALRDGVYVHPTLAESMNNLFASLES